MHCAFAAFSVAALNTEQMMAHYGTHIYTVSVTTVSVKAFQGTFQQKFGDQVVESCYDYCKLQLACNKTAYIRLGASSDCAMLMPWRRLSTEWKLLSIACSGPNNSVSYTMSGRSEALLQRNASIPMSPET